MDRLRIHYTKTGALRYTGNLDVHRLLERAFRRARLPLAYSQGFHPQPRINQAAPLPLGMSSRAEIVDIWLNDELPDPEIITKLEGALPDGMRLIEIEHIALSDPSLPTQVVSSDYIVTLKDSVEPSILRNKITDLLNQDSIRRERRGKHYDLRPLIESLEIMPEAGNLQQLRMRLSARESATGRPEEVLDALGIDFASTLIERTALIIK